MKYKISIQSGLKDVKDILVNEGYEVVDYGHNDSDANVVIVTGIDEAYEEIQPAEYHGKTFVIDGTNSSTEEILKRVYKHIK